jgi:hypothetical protein
MVRLSRSKSGRTELRRRKSAISCYSACFVRSSRSRSSCLFRSTRLALKFFSEPTIPLQRDRKPSTKPESIRNPSQQAKPAIARTTKYIITFFKIASPPPRRRLILATWAQKTQRPAYDPASVSLLNATFRRSARLTHGSSRRLPSSRTRC